MADYTRPVHCGTPGCAADAEYKIAAPWSAGRWNELKTYGLACGAHYAQSYKDALRRRKIQPPSAEEVVGEIGVYRFERGKPDKQLKQVPNPS
jgi:hypothetical protein